MVGAQKKSLDVYGYFDNILYNAESKIDNLNLNENSKESIDSYFELDVINKIGTINVFEQVRETNNYNEVIGFMDETAIYGIISLYTFYQYLKISSPLLFPFN